MARLAGSGIQLDLSDTALRRRCLRDLQDRIDDEPGLAAELGPVVDELIEQYPDEQDQVLTELLLNLLASPDSAPLWEVLARHKVSKESIPEPTGRTWVKVLEGSDPEAQDLTQLVHRTRGLVRPGGSPNQTTGLFLSLADLRPHLVRRVLGLDRAALDAVRAALG